MQSKHSTAIHEAGHAVAHFRLRIDQLGASIASDGNLAGYSHASSSVFNGRDAEDQVIAYCSGYAACLAANLPDADAGCGDDLEKAQELIESWQLGSLTEWQAKAVELLSRPENISAVALIAKHLLRWQTLDVDYMGMLLEVADGNMTTAEFDRYCDFRSRCDPPFAERYRQFRE
jgi:hypothetical protein